jgi:dienelactone hydrolase
MEVKMDKMVDLKQEAQDFIYQVAEGDFAGACRLFDQNMLQAFPQARLKESWLQLIGLAGPFQKISNCQAIERQETYMVTVSCQFEKAPMDIRVNFDQSGQIAGLNYQPVSGSSPYNPPAYVHAAAFHEVEVTVGSGEWALPGTLSLPEGADPFPAVVLVHGSDPQDRDETIGPNRPFRDLAWGLASQGIAVLRYEKRTKAYAKQLTPEMIARMTVQEEVIEDALAAVRLLRQTPEIVPGGIYVLGHSLGATLAPRIGQQDPMIAGLIIMAGMTRPFEDTILDQYTYLYSLSGEMSDGQKADLEQLKAKVRRVKDPNLSDQVPAKDLPLGVHPAYWLALRNYQPAEVAKSLAMRIFVLQGGRDYQITAASDFPAWQKALGEKRSAKLRVYPKLFHLFFAGEGPSTLQEYLVEGHISEEVIRDITHWIRNKKATRTFGDRTNELSSRTK